MTVTLKELMDFIKEAKKLGALEVSVSEASASVKFGSDATQSAAIIKDLVNSNIQDEEEDLLYWSSGS